MLINTKPSKISVGLYMQAKRLAEDARGITDDLFKGGPVKKTQHRIAILAKRYAELYTKLCEEENEI